MKLLFDTNILIDYLNGVPEARQVILAESDRAISTVTWIEAMAGADTKSDSALRSFLATFRVVALDGPVAEAAALIRRTHRLKLPDAVIWASAQVAGRTLVTRDAKDFPKDDPGIKIPYRLG